MSATLSPAPTSRLTAGLPTACAGDAAVLAGLLAEVRRALRFWIWVESLAWLGLWSGLCFWAAVGFDRLVEPPAWVRAVLLAVAGGGGALVIARKLVSRLAMPLRDETLALVVERIHPEFRDSLSTAIGLAAGRGEPVDQGLVTRTTAEAAACVGGVKTRGLFRARRLSLEAAAALAACLAAVGFVVLRPDLGTVCLRRLLFLTDAPWPRRVRLEAEGFRDGVRPVARGADVDVLVRVWAADGPTDIVDLRHLDGSAWKVERMGERGDSGAGGHLFGHVLRGVTRDVPLEIRGGDARLRGLRLKVVEPPAVATLSIRARLPDYLGGGLIQPALERSVAVPRGSRVEVECTATKPLAAAILAVRSAAAANESAAAERTIAAIDSPPQPPRVLTGVIEGLDADTALFVRLTDTDGLTNRDMLQCRFIAVADTPPRIVLRPAGGVSAVTPRGRFMLAGEISDDHGLVTAGVRLVPTRATAAAPDAGGDATAVRAVSIGRVRGGETLVVIPPDRPEVVAMEALGLSPGDRLTVFAEASDACPLDGAPQVGRSDAWTIDVVSQEQLQAMLEAREVLLRRRFEGVIADLARDRDAFAEAPADSARRLEDAADRAAGETAEIAAAFREVRAEFDHNDLLTREQDQRLATDIADPLAALGRGDLPGLAAACRDTSAAARAVLGRADLALASMRAILARMLELESLNEVVERLRRVIRAQEDLRTETLERQKKRARAVLEEP